jgi:di/tripeptidase
METKSCGGGFDSNILSSKGLLMPIIGIGYHDNHTVKEWLDIKTFNKTADLTLNIVKNYRKK